MNHLLKNSLALVAIIVGVQLLYSFIIHPFAAADLAAATARGEATARTIFIVIKDYEQQICIILMLWGIYLILTKCLTVIRTRYLFATKIISDADHDASLAVNMKNTLQELDAITDAEIREAPLIKTLRDAARRYIATGNAQDTSDAIITSVAALGSRIESENSMIRYLIWAIPSIGFIGTVRGIGQALVQAERALAGDISAMTASLGIAFNSTLVALFISIILMFMLHELQRLQDKLLVDTQGYAEEFLLKRIEKSE